jgi:hypothetical protein
MTEKQLITTVAAISISCLADMTRLYPDHTKLKRQIQKVETAIGEMARLANAPLFENELAIGVKAYKAAMAIVQEETEQQAQRA